MPVFLFTMHSYRSWMPDNPRGYVRRGQGVLEPDPGMAYAYNRAATKPPVRFSPAEYPIIAWIAYDCCQRRNWRLHAIAIVPTHTHLLVVSWRDETDRKVVFAKLKNLMSLELNRRAARRRSRWFSRSGSKQRVKVREHFEYLVDVYLPGHGGYSWKEGMDPPEEPG